ncbi:DNA transformation protein and related proteins [Janthinobacterium sp. CG_23.3]|uniref:TfoX/Sxy family DNA transformation protein n=1 Tax=Janthinobacterium sp. CG_23.3 TaxID=3349634 RepID=UPI0038D40AA3
MATVPALRIRDLKGLGPRSEQMFALVGILTVREFLATDPYVLYAKLKPVVPALNVLAIYAMIGAQQGRPWLEVKRELRGDILLRLDMMGLTPKKKPPRMK